MGWGSSGSCCGCTCQSGGRGWRASVRSGERRGCSASESGDERRWHGRQLSDEGRRWDWGCRSTGNEQNKTQKQKRFPKHTPLSFCGPAPAAVCSDAGLPSPGPGQGRCCHSLPQQDTLLVSNCLYGSFVVPCLEILATQGVIAADPHPQICCPPSRLSLLALSYHGILCPDRQLSAGTCQFLRRRRMPNGSRLHTSSAPATRLGSLLLRIVSGD